MKHQSYDLSVIVNNLPITEYQHEGNTFVEGRKGSEFTVKFKNNNYNRVLVVPSVDGLSVFDGKPADQESKGYVVNGNSILEIPGWTLDPNNVAKFFFQGKESSYASHVSGDQNTNSGVIGLLVFSEKTPYITPTIVNTNLPFNANYNPNWYNQVDAQALSNVRGVISANNTMYSKSAVLASGSVNSVQQSTTFDLGAGFGEKADFKTTTTSFAKDIIVAQMSIYYDSRKNLERRGIVIVKKPVSNLPQAFPKMGCTPPPGWRG